MKITLPESSATGTASEGWSAVYFDRHGGEHCVGGLKTGIYVEQIGPDVFLVQVHHDDGQGGGISRWWPMVNEAAGQAIRDGQAEAQRIVTEAVRGQWELWKKNGTLDQKEAAS